jgi:phosphinothricin acetyltransferase
MNARAQVSVRAATAADAAAICAIYAPVVRDTVISFEAEPPDTAEIRRRMTVAQVRLPWLVAQESHGVIGYAYAAAFRGRDAYRWSVETSVYIAAPARRSGTARRLYAYLLDELRALGYVSAYAGIALPNEASVALHSSIGFSPVGVFTAAGFKHGRWVDVGWWALALGPLPAVPTPPRAWRPGPSRSHG